MPYLYVKRDGSWDKFALSPAPRSLLDALYCARSLDPSLRFRSSCGAGMCGSCAVQLDGKPVLACQARLDDHDHWVEPLPGFEVIKDLEVDKKRIYDEECEALAMMPSRCDLPDWEFTSSGVDIKHLPGCAWCGICTSACTTRDIDWGAGARLIVASQTIAEKKHYNSPLPPSLVHQKLACVRNEYRTMPRNGDDLNTIYKHMLWCTACGRCEEFCPKGIKNKVQVLELAKERLFERGATPLHTKFLKNYPAYNSYGEPPENRLAWLPPDVKFSDNPEVALFIGCTASYRRTESALALIRILQALGVPFAIPTGERCCGSSFIRAGVGKRAKAEFMPHNVRLLADTHAGVVLTSCSGCARTWNKDYPVYYQGHMPFKVKHITQWLSERVEGGLKLPQLGLKATYHDSCHLGRGMGVYDAPRKVMEAMGIEIVEMEFSRSNSHCCGGGGGMKSAHPTEAVQIASKRVREAEVTGADLVLTACVFCTTNLMDACKAMGSGMRVVNIETVLAEAIARQSSHAPMT